MNYKYNELGYAKLIYENGFQSKHIYTELRLLVLYFRDVLGFKAKEREYAIYEFCQNNIPGFKREKLYKIINKVLKVGSKKEQELIVIPKIDIYKTELDYINSLAVNQEYKKVMFTFLVQYKLNKIVYEQKYNKEYGEYYFKGGIKKYNNIKKISNIPREISLNDEIINELNNLKLITILYRGTICLNYIKNCKQEGEIAIAVTDFENIGLYLDYYNNISGIIKCEKCGKIIKINSNRQHYCQTCRKEIDKEQTRQRVQKFRKCNGLENLEKH